MENIYYIENEKIYLNIKATPNASKNEITGIKDNRLCIRIASPPEDGKANTSLCKFLAKTLGCANSSVALVKGEKSRLKTVSMPVNYIQNLETVCNIHYTIQ
jgi:uncharacterized protein (TIGR00251 family)